MKLLCEKTLNTCTNNSGHPTTTSSKRSIGYQCHLFATQWVQWSKLGSFKWGFLCRGCLRCVTLQFRSFACNLGADCCILHFTSLYFSPCQKKHCHQHHYNVSALMVPMAALFLTRRKVQACSQRSCLHHCSIYTLQWYRQRCLLQACTSLLG